MVWDECYWFILSSKYVMMFSSSQGRMLRDSFYWFCLWNYSSWLVTRLDKVQLQDCCLSEKLPTLGIIECLILGPAETDRTSQHYCVKKFRGAPMNVPSFCPRDAGLSDSHCKFVQPRLGPLLKSFIETDMGVFELWAPGIILVMLECVVLGCYTSLNARCTLARQSSCLAKLCSLLLHFTNWSTESYESGFHMG